MQQFKIYRSAMETFWSEFLIWNIPVKQLKTVGVCF
jgi:hypothetical protein